MKKMVFLHRSFCAAASKLCGVPWWPVAGCIVREIAYITCDAPAGGTFFYTATSIARSHGSTLNKEVVLAQLLQFGSSGWIVAIRFHRGSVVRLLLNVGRMCEIVTRR